MINCYNNTLEKVLEWLKTNDKITSKDKVKFLITW